MRAFQSEHGGKLLFSEQAARVEGVFRELFVKCGQCIGCRLERSRQWATRCMHEASLHDCNSFVTLTYDEAHAPVDHTLQKHWDAHSHRYHYNLSVFQIGRAHV